MDKQSQYICISIVIISILCIGYWNLARGYETIEGNLKGWNRVNAMGFNVWFNDREKTLFLHGDDWRLNDFLETLEVNKTYKFHYHIEVVGCDTDCGCTSWNHIIWIKDMDDTLLFGTDLWQEW